jgi:hypothetical protein
MNKNGLTESENKPAYLKLVMIKEAAFKRYEELANTEKLQESMMTNNYLKALKIAARGGKLSEAQIKSLKVSAGMKAVLESATASQKFMRKIIENKKSKRALTEGEIDTAQTTLAAQDIADQIQTMIEKFADVKYKNLPALHDNIRNSQGVEAAEAFNTSLVSSLDVLTSTLEQVKGDVNNAVAVLTGQDVAMGDNDLDVDEFGASDELDLDMDIGDDEMDLGMDDDEGFDLDLEADEEEVDLGRERR